MNGVATDLDEVASEPSTVVVGFFDGVHRGHQAIVRRALEAAAGTTRTVAVTFDRHPMEVLRPGSQPRYLMSLDRRVGTLLRLEVDLVVVLPFTLELSRQPPEDFVGEVLRARLGARHVVVGENFRFGHRAAGDVDLLRSLGTDAGFEVSAVPLLEIGGEPVSSTSIRDLLDAGDVAGASRMLGRPHIVDGTVVRGEGRGRSIGIPTANLEIDTRMQLPASGVYAGHAVVDPVPAGPAGTRRPAVMNIGVRPTFGGERPVVEAHLLDTTVELYGRHLAVHFEHRLRDEQRFDGPDELVAQIRRDIDRARELA